MHACAYCLCAFTLSAVYRSISFTLDIAPRSSQTVLISTWSITFLLHFPHPSYSRALHLCAFIKLFCGYCWQFCLCFCLFYSFSFCFKSHIHSDFFFLFLASSLFFCNFMKSFEYNGCECIRMYRILKMLLPTFEPHSKRTRVRDRMPKKMEFEKNRWNSLFSILSTLIFGNSYFNLSGTSLWYSQQSDSGWKW